MSRTRNRRGSGCILAGGLLLVAVLGMYGYVRATLTPLHPNPQDVSSVTHRRRRQKWAGAVEQARQTVRGPWSSRIGQGFGRGRGR